MDSSSVMTKINSPDQKNKTPFIKQKKEKPKSNYSIKKGNNSYQKKRFRPVNPVVNITPLSTEKIQLVKRIPVLKKGDLRVSTVCGVEWITTNMTMVEYDDEIVIIDAGLGFPNKSMYGVDYTIPDVTYLEVYKHKIKAIVITHGHLDHVGALPHILERLGNPPIYVRAFGAKVIQKRLVEFKDQVKQANIITVDNDADYIKLGKHFSVKFFGLTHSIPDSSGVIVRTPLGGVVSTGDVRVENYDGIPSEKEREQYSFFKDENILLLAMDSTNIENPGWSMSERKVVESIDSIVKNANGRLLLACFSSQVERLMSFADSAKKHNKYVCYVGRSIESYMSIAKELGLTKYDHVINVRDINKYPPNKIVMCVTGSQGEEFAALNRITRGQHKDIKLDTTDTIVLSASVIPGNDYAVAQLKNFLFRHSYNVLTYRDNIVHASGHANREELKWVNQQIPYKYFMPVHGEPYMTRMHAKMVHEELGVAKNKIYVTDNGSILEFRNAGKDAVLLEEHLPNDITVVDGTYSGSINQSLMNERKRLSQSGIFNVVVTLRKGSYQLVKSPDIYSRGFVYLRDSMDLLKETRELIRSEVLEYVKSNKEFVHEDLKKQLNRKIENYLHQQTHKEPIVLCSVVTV